MEENIPSLERLIHDFKITSKDDMKSSFDILAKRFLFGGYFIVGNKTITLKDIEFYYHEEEDANRKRERIVDEKMYHIQANIPKEVPLRYFAPGSLHEHVSGLDFCFENEKLHFRASILLRAVEVCDNIECRIENRPTYIPGLFLMGNSVFEKGFNISWKDTAIQADAVLPSPIKRKNLPDGFRYSLLIK